LAGVCRHPTSNHSGSSTPINNGTGQQLTVITIKKRVEEVARLRNKSVEEILRIKKGRTNKKWANLEITLT